MPVQCWNCGPSRLDLGALADLRSWNQGPSVHWNLDKGREWHGVSLLDMCWGSLQLPGGLSSLAGCGLLLPSREPCPPCDSDMYEKGTSGWGKEPKTTVVHLRVLVCTLTRLTTSHIHAYLSPSAGQIIWA